MPSDQSEDSTQSTEGTQNEKPPILSADRNPKKAVQPKKVELRCLPEQIGQKTIDRVINYYTRGEQLSSICSIVNGPRGSADTIALIDCYSILYHAIKAGKVQQRKKFLDFELQIVEFAEIFRAWRVHEKPSDILKLFPNRKTGCERALNSLKYRYRETKVLADELANATALKVLSLAHHMIVEGRPAFVIFGDEIPEGSLRVVNAEEHVISELNENLLGESAVDLLSTMNPIHRELAEDLIASHQEGNIDKPFEQHIKKLSNGTLAVLPRAVLSEEGARHSRETEEQFLKGVEEVIPEAKVQEELERSQEPDKEKEGLSSEETKRKIDELFG